MKYQNPMTVCSMVQKFRVSCNLDKLLSHFPEDECSELSELILKYLFVWWCFILLDEHKHELDVGDVGYSQSSSGSIAWHQTNWNIWLLKLLLYSKITLRLLLPLAGLPHVSCCQSQRKHQDFVWILEKSILYKNQTLYHWHGWMTVLARLDRPSL